MIEPCRKLYLPEKTFRAEGRRKIGMKHLERDGAIVLAVLGKVDGGHAAASELAVDDIRIRKRFAQPFNGEGQVGLPE